MFNQKLINSKLSKQFLKIVKENRNQKKGI